MPDREAGVQRSHGLLEDHRKLLSAQRAQRFLVGEIDAAAVQPERAALDVRARRKQAHQGQDRQRLAAARLADQTQRFRGHEIETQVADERALLRALAGDDAQAAHRHHGRARRVGEGGLERGLVAPQPGELAMRRPCPGLDRRVAQRVAQQAEREDRQRHHAAAGHQQPREVVEARRRVEDAATPGGRRRLHAETEKADAGLHDHRNGRDQRQLHDHRTHDAGQHMAQDDRRVGQAGDARRLDVELVAHIERGAADHPRDAGRSDDAERHHRGEHRTVEHGQHGQRDDDHRQGLKQIRDLADHGIGAAAEVARGQAHADAQQRGHDQRLNHARERGQRAVEHAAQHVAPQFVATEPMLGGGQLLDRQQVLLERIERRHLVGEQAHRDDRRQPDDGDPCERLAQQPRDEAPGHGDACRCARCGGRRCRAHLSTLRTSCSPARREHSHLGLRPDTDSPCGLAVACRRPSASGRWRPGVLIGAPYALRAVPPSGSIRTWG